MSLHREKRTAKLKKIAGNALYEFTIYDVNDPAETEKWGSQLSYDVLAQLGGRRFFLGLEPTGGISFKGDFNELRAGKIGPENYLSKLESGVKDGWVKKTSNEQISEELRDRLAEFLDNYLEDSSGVVLDKEAITDPSRQDLNFPESKTIEV